MYQNYPNPFSSSTAIPYKIQKQLDVTVTIFDILGREVRTFQVSHNIAGTHELQWDGKDNFGTHVGVGVYFYRLQTSEKIQVKKMIFAGCSTSLDMLPISGFPSNETGLEKEDIAQISGRTFKVEIKDISCTRPKILSTEFQDVVVQQDTTLNFEVQLGIMAYSLCYHRVDTLVESDGTSTLAWSIHMNNITGTNPKTIISRKRSSRYPKWSPDGKYIGFTYEDSLGYYHLYLYNTAYDTIITYPAGTYMGLWAPNSKLVYRNQFSWYMMDPDGSNNRKLNYPVEYFYLDSYNTLYWVKQSSKGSLVYHSNVDGTMNEFIVDLGEFVHTDNGGVTVFDFDPNANELLLSFNDPSTALPNMIAKYNIIENRLDTVVVSDSGWKCYRPKYSHDFNKIAIAEVNYTDTINSCRISILENGTKTALVEFPHKDEQGKSQFIDYNPFAFSPDDKYLTFSKNVVQNAPDQMVWWISYLYVVELETKQMTLIDIGSMGINTVWNPKKPH